MTDQATETAEAAIEEAPADVAAGSETQTDDQDQNTEGEDGVDGKQPDDQTEAAAVELDEFEWEGAKVQLPKEIAELIKPALLRTQDYTVKTQELAETRRALEARDASLNQQAEAIEALRVDHGRVASLEERVAEFAKLPWDELREADKDTYRDLRDEYAEAKDKLATAKTELSTKADGLRLERERATATALQETGKELAKSIKGWSPQVAQQIVEHATTEYGVDLQEMRELADPRIWRALHDGMTAQAELAALKAKQTKAQGHQAAQSTTPAARVGGGTAPHARRTTDASGDGLSTAEWMRREDEREAAARKRA
ncbi:hypothetical protein [Phenylobacterium sp.]|uniref:hypothetical protein n=1 Tax=Phenylobacterium sp. TaxID=1871053 RepID=UPI002FCC60AD